MTDVPDHSSSSRSSLTLGLSDVAARLQNLRNLLNNERHTGAGQRRALEALDREMDEMSADRLANRAELRRREYEASRESDTTTTAEEMTTSGSPSSLVRTRRRAFRPSERLQRHQRERLAQEARFGSASTYSPLTSQPPPVLPNPHSATDECYGRAVETLPSKRRKLDDGTYEDESKTFSYGHKGQVIPGHLKMDIISCDGGEFSAPYMRATSWPQSILVDDKSVYSTKSNRCNILLKHVGGMPFSLTKLVVSAPRSGFDAPIQEGIVFVSMTDHKLLEDTAQYEKRYRSHEPGYNRRPYPGSLPPSHEYLRSTRSPLQSIDRSRYLRDPHPPWTDAHDTDIIPVTEYVPGFNVSLGDDSDGAESVDSPLSPRPWLDLDAEYSLRSYTDRYRRGYSASARPPVDSATSSESEDDADVAAAQTQLAALTADGTRARQRRLIDYIRAREQVEVDNQRYGYHALDPEEEEEYEETQAPSSNTANLYNPPVLEPPILPTDSVHPARLPSIPHPSSPAPKPMHATEPGQSPTKPKIAPHAHFFIRRNKSSVAIKFSPPVAGRYILLKLWASCPNNNIDIQSVVPYGYGGPRFFPSSELR